MSRRGAPLRPLLGHLIHSSLQLVRIRRDKEYRRHVLLHLSGVLYIDDVKYTFARPVRVKITRVG